MNLQELLKEFLFDCKLRKLSERTIKGYRNSNLALLRFISEEYSITKIEEVNHKVLQGYINYLSETGRKEGYINGLIKSYRAFLAYCVGERYININPVDKVRSQKQPIPVINTYSIEEVSRMIKYYKGGRFLDVRNCCIMTLLFDSGIRASELCNLKITDIRQSYINILGKGKKTRHVPLTSAINKQLIRYNRVREQYIKDKTNYDTEYLFLSQKGKKLTVEALERIVKFCGEAVGVREEIRISPHTCRHFYAQQQLVNGCDLFILSRLLGHSKIDVTKIYLNSLEMEKSVEIGALTSPLACMG
ncbi:MAG: tyrosine-type recombinase/integrase [Herbinix sp.]|nr:tyrosine-type recombinase/integrase [Herbinix sp.]